MDTFDAQRAGDVWRRVMMGPPGDAGVEGLLLPALEALADYRFLSTALTGRARQAAGRLHSRQQETVETLRGLALLCGCQGSLPRSAVPGRVNVQVCIQRSYHRARRAAAEYTARTAEPITGAAFRVLAAREEESCAMLAGMMGAGV